MLSTASFDTDKMSDEKRITPFQFSTGCPSDPGQSYLRVGYLNASGV